MKCIPKYTNVNPSRQEWVDLLDRYVYDWFCHLTFKDLPRTFTAQNRFYAFIKAIQRKEKVDIGYYVGMETTVKGRYHFHALLGGLPGIYILPWWKWWFTRYGRAKIERYDPKLKASHYVTKYTTKSMAWYDIHNVHILDTYKKDVSKICNKDT